MKKNKIYKLTPEEEKIKKINKSNKRHNIKQSLNNYLNNTDSIGEDDGFESKEKFRR